MHRTCTARETGEPILIWVDCEVVKIADGLSDKVSERCKKMLPAGAVLVKWPADNDRGEKESLRWRVIIPNKFKRIVRMRGASIRVSLRPRGRLPDRLRGPMRAARGKMGNFRLWRPVT